MRSSKPHQVCLHAFAEELYEVLDIYEFLYAENNLPFDLDFYRRIDGLQLAKVNHHHQHVMKSMKKKVCQSAKRA